MAHKSNASDKCLYAALPLWSFTKQEILVSEGHWLELETVLVSIGIDLIFFFLHVSLYRFTSDRPCYLQLLKKCWLKVRCKLQCTPFMPAFCMILENSNWTCELKIKFLHFKPWHKWLEMGVGTCFMSAIFHVYSKKLLLPAFCHFYFFSCAYHFVAIETAKKTTLLVWNLLFRCFIPWFFFLSLCFPHDVTSLLASLVWSLETWD